MIATSLTLTAGGSTVTLGARTMDSAGNFVGFTLDDFTIDPAPLSAYNKALPLISGGVVVAGRAGVRRLTVSGTIVGSDADSANALRKNLVAVLRDHDGDLIAATWTVATVARTVRGALNGSVEFSLVGGSMIAYKAELVCPDPVAYATTASTSPAAASQTVTNAGDANVWPTLTVSFTGSCSTLRVGSTTSGRYIELASLAAVSGDTLVIDTRPGYELVELNGTSVLSKLTAASRFWSLSPGANAVYVSNVAPTGANVALSVGWTDGWVS